MSWKVENRLLVISGYKNDGAPIWKKIGVIMKQGNKEFMLLDRSFNPSGIPIRDDQEGHIMVTIAPAVYEDKNKPAEKKEKLAFHDVDDDVPF